LNVEFLGGRSIDRMLIAATRNADVDVAKWEREFSLEANGQSIMTRVYPLR
jgi:hypothetical protein